MCVCLSPRTHGNMGGHSGSSAHQPCSLSLGPEGEPQGPPPRGTGTPIHPSSPRAPSPAAE